MSTGRFARPSRRSRAWAASKESLEKPPIARSPEAKSPGITCGRKKRELKEPSLSSGRCPSTERREKDGNGYGNLPYPGILSLWKPR